MGCDGIPIPLAGDQNTQWCSHECLTPDGEMRTTGLTDGLMHRNFVKRAVVMPGDTFFIMGGDLYLQQDDGNWQVSPRPEALVEAQLQTIYQQGAQGGLYALAGIGRCASRDQ